jgi:transcriptional regulator with GAF, ATPase, and Fis domain
MLLVSRNAAAIFGYEPEELLFGGISTLFGEHQSHPAALGHRCELSGVRKDGSPVPIDVTIRTVDDAGECWAILSVRDLMEVRPVGFESPSVDQAYFLRLIADMAVRCSAASPDDADGVIVEALSEFAAACGLDRCIVYVPDSEIGMRASHSWAAAGCPLPPDGVSATEAFPWTMAKVRTGQAIWISDLDEVPDPIDRASIEELGTRSRAVIPLVIHGSRHGALVFDSLARRSWAPTLVDVLQLAAAVIDQALARQEERIRLEEAMNELRRLRYRTADENVILRREVSSLRTDRTIAAESVAVRRVLAQLEQVAPTTATVLLLGETGCGKEVFAQAIHDLSPRAKRPMIRVSCAAIPTALIESELFGRERGAYTGALSRQIGRFELAQGSTIFLDEVGDLSLEVQVKLLRVLQERTIERLGGNQSVKVDVRVIAATNRDLEKAVAAGTFREDLYYRLNVFPIRIPALRERVDDIQSLVWTFIDEFSRAFNKPVESISKESLALLQRYNWPGNVRELRNLIEREMIIATSPHLSISAPRPSFPQKHSTGTRLVDVEVDHIRTVLESCGWRVRGVGGAAERLGIKPTTLESRMARLGIMREKKRAQA